jgi:hypothetical protein
MNSKKHLYLLSALAALLASVSAPRAQAEALVAVDFYFVCRSLYDCPALPYGWSTVYPARWSPFDVRKPASDFISTAVNPYFVDPETSLALDRFYVSNVVKALEPAYFNIIYGDGRPAMSAKSALTRKYGIPGHISVFIVNSIDAVAAYADRDVALADRPSIVISPSYLYLRYGNTSSHILAHELMHILGSAHVADSFGPSTRVFKYSECGLSVSWNIKSVSDYQLIHDNIMDCGRNHLMSYAVPELDGACGPPSLFTLEFSSRMNSIISCWNRKNR